MLALSKIVKPFRRRAKAPILLPTTKAVFFPVPCYMGYPQARIQRGARGPGPSLSDHTTIIKFIGPLLKYFLHSFSIV